MRQSGVLNITRRLVLAACLTASAAMAADDLAARKAAAEKLFGEVVSAADMREKFRVAGDAVVEKYKNAPVAARNEARALVDQALAEVMATYHEFFVRFYMERLTEEELIQLTQFVKLSRSPTVARFRTLQPEFKTESDRVSQEIKKKLTVELTEKVRQLVKKYQ